MKKLFEDENMSAANTAASAAGFLGLAVGCLTLFATRKFTRAAKFGLIGGSVGGGL